MQFHPFRDDTQHVGQQRLTRNISKSKFSGDPPRWDSFVRLWERANLVRELFCQQITDEKVLLSYFLARLRGLYSADFCFGYLATNGRKLAEAGLPEAAISHLPENFRPLCLDLIGNSRAPIISNKLRGGLGHRSAVVVPLTAQVGGSLGFFMLGHSTSRSYSSADLFLLRALATELSWAVRALSAKKCHQEELAGASHDVKNALQVILGNSALIRLKLDANRTGDLEKHLVHIESGAQEILGRLNRLSAESLTEEFETSGNSRLDIIRTVDQSIAGCRRAAAERGVDIEVVCAPEDIVERAPEQALPRAVLDAVMSHAVQATRSEIIRLGVRCDAERLELIIKGMESNRVAEKLNSLMESTSRVEGARDEGSETLASMKGYLKTIGGDVYVRSRPGETAEFVVWLPLERRRTQSGRPKNLKVSSA